MAELLRITPQDNVAVALTALSSGQNVTVDGIALTTVTDVPAGHKVALFPIQGGRKGHPSTASRLATRRRTFPSARMCMSTICTPGCPES